MTEPRRAPSPRSTPGAPARALRSTLAVLAVAACSIFLPRAPAEAADPRCDNCQPVEAVLYECLHYAEDPDGAPCSTTACIQNTLDSASCQFHPEATGAAQCDTDTTQGPEIVQVVRQSSCPGGTVQWSDWRTLYSGCGTACEGFTWRKACETSSCTGTVILGPYNRGEKKKCGC